MLDGHALVLMPIARHPRHRELAWTAELHSLELLGFRAGGDALPRRQSNGLVWEPDGAAGRVGLDAALHGRRRTGPRTGCSSGEQS